MGHLHGGVGIVVPEGQVQGTPDVGPRTRPFQPGTFTRQVDARLDPEPELVEVPPFDAERLGTHVQRRPGGILEARFLHGQLHHVGVRRDFQRGRCIHGNVSTPTVVEPGRLLDAPNVDHFIGQRVVFWCNDPGHQGPGDHGPFDHGPHHDVAVDGPQRIIGQFPGRGIPVDSGDPNDGPGIGVHHDRVGPRGITTGVRFRRTDQLLQLTLEGRINGQLEVVPLLPTVLLDFLGDGIVPRHFNLFFGLSSAQDGFVFLFQVGLSHTVVSGIPLG